MIRQRICFFLASKICILCISACGVDFQNITIGGPDIEHLNYACGGTLSVKNNVTNNRDIYDHYRCVRGYVHYSSNKYTDIDYIFHEFIGVCRGSSGHFDYGGIRGKQENTTISASCIVYKTKIF